MLTQSVLVKDLIYQDLEFSKFCQAFDIEAGALTAQSYLLCRFFIESQTSGVLRFESLDLAYFSMLGRYFGFLQNEISVDRDDRISFMSEHEKLESQALSHLAQRLRGLSPLTEYSGQSQLSLLIPHRNRSQSILQLLQHLKDSSVNPLEVIIGDDHSVETEFQALQQSLALEHFPFPIKLISVETSGAPAVRNELARVAQGPLLAFVDDDNLPMPEMVKYFSRLSFCDDFDIFVGPYERVFVDSLAQPMMSGTKKRIWLPIGGDLELGSAFNTLGDMNFCIKKDFYHEMGGLDEKGNLAAEDWDFLYRVLQAGGRIAVIPELLQVYRDHSASFFKRSARIISESRIFGRRARAENLESSLLVENHVARLRSDYLDPMISEMISITQALSFGARFCVQVTDQNKVRLTIPHSMKLRFQCLSRERLLQEGEMEYNQGVYWFHFQLPEPVNQFTFVVNSLDQSLFGFEI
ncbi:MAG: glycosyltransferase family 2 protein [Pseudobdellovibrionaceae bacterium]